MSHAIEPTSLTLAFSVRDRQAAAVWYLRHLGFEVLYDSPELGWCELTTTIPHVTLGLGEREGIHIGGPVPTFEVTDLDAVRKQLENDGVRFEGGTIVHDGFVKLATFFDLDGHALMLSESLATDA